MNNYKKLALLYIVNLSMALSLNAGGYMGVNLPIDFTNYEIESLDQQSNTYYYGIKEDTSASVGIEIVGGYGFSDAFSGEVSFKYADVSLLSTQLRYGFDFFDNSWQPFVLAGVGIPLFHSYTVNTEAIPYTGSGINNSFEGSYPVKIGAGTSYVLDENYVLRTGINFTLPYSIKTEKGDFDADVASNVHVNSTLEIYIGISYDFSGTSTLYHQEAVNDEIWEEEEDDELDY